MKKISLVTGGAGFLGSNMVDFLLKKNHKVIAIDDLSTGLKENLKHHSLNKNFFFLKKDITKVDFKEIKIKKIDYIFHFAGKAALVPSIKNPVKYFFVNYFGTLNLLNNLKRIRFKKLIYAASSSCYGKAKTPTDEKAKISLLHPYAASKYHGEQLCLHWNKTYGFPINSIRIFNAYGNRVSFNQGYGAAFSVFLKQKLEKKPLTIIGDGRQKRDFVFAEDLAEAFYLCAKSNYAGEIFNLGYGKAVSVNKIAKLIGGKQIKIPKRPGEPQITLAKINKIKKYLKWKPKTTIDTGISKMLKNIHYWKKGKLWNKNNIKKETKEWFKLLK
jgi:UDP-glucose 4-epimerase